jgi:hypothetical protein
MRRLPNFDRDIFRKQHFHNSPALAMSYGTTRSPAAQVASSDPLLPDEDQTSQRPPSPAASATEAEGPGPNTLWQKTKAFYGRNLGLFFVFLAQIFGSIVSS